MLPEPRLVPPPGSQRGIADRIRTVLAGLDLDCSCRERLDAALSAFVALEEKRGARQALMEARHQRETIVALLGLLSEIDEIGFSEPDTSVFEEIALLFEDIGRAAQCGAAAIRKAAATP